eukprot:TRINITY_DN10576_c0_g1_i1.p1 TRINITY_DN10576_c0_g1~~TRINITY_DN10576_c0_g1_i1.p1  ORF type:complete len:524 (-),score=128.36 TRINITY_DN10576_c0_g1_i1:203-1774(-)
MTTLSRKYGGITHDDILAAASVDLSHLRSHANTTNLGVRKEYENESAHMNATRDYLQQDQSYHNDPNYSRQHVSQYRDEHAYASFTKDSHGINDSAHISAQSSTIHNATDRSESSFRFASRVEDILSSFDKRLQTEELLARAPITHTGGYTREFVLSLEEHYREQLVAQLSTIHEAAHRRLLLKEDELNQMHENIREMHNVFSAKEKALLDEVERLQKEKDEQTESLKHQLQLINDQQEQEIQKLQIKHAKDLEKAAQESEIAVKKVCEWARNQLINLDSKLETQRISFQQQLDSVESGKALEVSRIHEQKDQTVGEIKQLLALTEMRLLESKKEIETINHARHEDLTALRSQLEECLRVIHRKDSDYSKSIQTLQKEHAQREADLRKQIQQERLKKEVDKQELQYQVDLLKDRLSKLQQYVKDAEHRYVTEIKRLSEDNHKTLLAFNSAQSQIQQDSQQYIKLSNMARDYEREITVLKNELLLTQNEERRLREENTEFRMEITRLDKAIHGKASTLGRSHGV